MPPPTHTHKSVSADGNEAGIEKRSLKPSGDFLAFPPLWRDAKDAIEVGGVGGWSDYCAQVRSDADKGHDQNSVKTTPDRIPFPDFWA